MAHVLSGKSVVVTGTFSKKRSELEAALKGLGAVVVGAVSGKTDMLFVGTDAGSKLAAAKKLGVPVKSERDLMKLLEDNNSKTPATKKVEKPTSKPVPKAFKGAVKKKVATEKTRPAKSPKTKSGSENSALRQRLLDMIEALKGNKAVAVVYAHIGTPLEIASLQKVASSAGVKLTPEQIAFYSEVGEFYLVWAPIHHPSYDAKVHKPKPGRPNMFTLEQLDTAAFRIIAMPTLNEVLVKNPMTYDSDDDIARYGFDFPGNFETPALVKEQDGTLNVAVGSDYGADWDSRTTTFGDYVELVISSWGDVASRRTFYQSGKKAKAPAPITLESLLPKPPKGAAVNETALLRTLKSAGSAKNLDDDQLAQAAAALGSQNEALGSLIAQRLSEAGTRCLPFVQQMFDALDVRPGLAGTLIFWLERLHASSGLTPSLENAAAVLRAKHNTATHIAAQLVALAGAKVSPLLHPYLAATPDKKDTFALAAQETAAYVALMVGDESTKPFLTKLAVGADKEQTAAVIARATLARLEPESAIAQQSGAKDILWLARELRDASPSILAPLARVLPAAIQKEVATAIETSFAQEDDEYSKAVTLLPSLGTSGVAAALRALAVGANEGFNIEDLCGALATAKLSPAERAKAAAVLTPPAKRGDPDLGIYVLFFGGAVPTGPMMKKKEFIENWTSAYVWDQLANPVLDTVLDYLESEKQTKSLRAQAAQLMQDGMICPAMWNPRVQQLAL